MTPRQPAKRQGAKTDKVEALDDKWANYEICPALSKCGVFMKPALRIQSAGFSI